METWIRSTFEIVPDGWVGVNPETGEDLPPEDAFAFESGGRRVEAPIAWFVQRFGPDAPASAADLKAKDPNDTLGWHRHFDAWVAQGILPQ